MLGLLDRFYVRKILKPSGCLLRRDEVIGGNEIRLEAGCLVDDILNATLPCRFEVDVRYLRQNVNANRRTAHAKDGPAWLKSAAVIPSRYLTRCPFKIDKSSLKSGYIRDLALHRILFLSKLGNRSDALMHRAALPVPIFVGLSSRRSR